ncbi:MAG TPA: ATP-dependent Clp protease ATP-binding subunit, partial [Candidatus Avimonas sp.]|nr:ATP-dependent Clp protease ATP-binding subunit [Candidatus Avimonas sp.]
MICTRCKKRPAVVFITRMDGDKSVNDGLCLVCAKELGIKPVDELLEKFGITEEDMEQMEEQLGELMDPNSEEDGFTPGGAATFPFLQNLFGNFPGSAKEGKSSVENDSADDKASKSQKKKE